MAQRKGVIAFRYIVIVDLPQSKTTMTELHSKSREIEYLIFSSKPGIVFREENGRFFVDKTYTFNVSDDVQAILRENKKIEDELNEVSRKEWLEFQQKHRESRRRHVLRYEEDFRLVANEPGRTADASVTLCSDGVPVAVASFMNKVSLPTRIIDDMMPFDKSKVSSFSFAQAARDAMVAVLRQQDDTEGARRSAPASSLYLQQKILFKEQLSPVSCEPIDRKGDFIDGETPTVIIKVCCL